MRRGTFTNGESTRKLAALIAQLEQAMNNGEDVKAAALQMQIDALRAETEDAKAAGQNAQQMVRNRDPRLATLEGVASTVQAALTNGDTEHARLDQRITDIHLTPGPPGKDGADGRDGVDGATGRAGTDGKTGDKGDTGQRGSDGTPADMTRVAALEQRQVQIEYRDGIPIPAMLSLLGSAATVDIPITWPTPFPDSNYLPTVQATPLDATLIGRTSATVKAKTATGITVTVTTTAVLAAGKCVLSAVAYRKN